MIQSLSNFAEGTRVDTIQHIRIKPAKKYDVKIIGSCAHCGRSVNSRWHIAEGDHLYCREDCFVAGPKNKAGQECVINNGTRISPTQGSPTPSSSITQQPSEAIKE